MSKENIEIIKRAGYEYIVGSKIKNKPTFLKEEILNLRSYQPIERRRYFKI